MQEGPGADALSFTAQGDQPKYGSEGTGDGEVGSQVDADQYGTFNDLGYPGVLYGITRDQAGWQVIHQVADKGNEEAAAPGCPGNRAGDVLLQEGADGPDQTGFVERFYNDKEAADKGED